MGKICEIDLAARLPGSFYLAGYFGETHATHGTCINFPRVQLAALEITGMVRRCEQVNVAMDVFSC